LFSGSLRSGVKIAQIFSEFTYPVETAMLFAGNKKGSCRSPFWFGAEGRTRTGTGYAHYPLKIACLPIPPLRLKLLVGGRTWRPRPPGPRILHQPAVRLKSFLQLLAHRKSRRAHQAPALRFPAVLFPESAAPGRPD